jgi:hypothetical protein
LSHQRPVINKVFICHNQTSLSVTREILINGNFLKVYIFYDPLRCDISDFSNLNCTLIAQTYLDALIFFLKLFKLMPFELFVPHFRWKVSRLMLFFSSKYSFIDDGLDTLRNVPLNIIVKEHHKNDFYTFKYSNQLGSWLNQFMVKKVSTFERIRCNSKPIYDLNKYITIIIESPGVERYLVGCSHDKNKTLYVKHSNPNKRISNELNYHELDGGDFALESSLLNYKGNLVMGETMVGVYLLNLKSSFNRLSFCIKKENIENLTCFVEIGKNDSRVSYVFL